MKGTTFRIIFFLAAALLSGRAAGMVFPGEGEDWEEATPESQGVDAALLDDAVAYLAGELAGTGGASELVVIRNGYLIHDGGNIDRMHDVWSVTKSFTSTVLGHLIDHGRCSLDTLGSDHVSRLEDLYPGVTLRHFATMTSGYDAEGGTYGAEDPDDGSHTPLVPADPAFVPGTMFSYFDDAMRMNGYVITMIVGTDLESYFRQNVALPIGMPDAGWSWGNYSWDDMSNPDGADVRNACSNLNITARELARLGHLYLNRGDWDGTRIISAAWVDQATSVQVPADMEGRDDTPRQQSLSADGIGRYGYNWWTNGTNPDGQRLWPAAPAGTYAASGFNNNKCFVIPEWSMVIVRMGTDGSPGNSNGVWSVFLGMVGDALVGGEPQEVTGFILVNADTDDDAGPLADGAAISLAGPAGRNLNVRAETSPADVGSVRFELDGVADYALENTPPYALAGDTAGDYHPWTPAVGPHTLTAVPYTGANATGTEGTGLTVTFTVFDGVVPDPDGEPDPDLPDAPADGAADTAPGDGAAEPGADAGVDAAGDGEGASDGGCGCRVV